jgi:hypothetical protein
VKITAVEGLLLSCPLPSPLKLPFWNGERTILKRDAMLIRVTTDRESAIGSRRSCSERIRGIGRRFTSPAIWRR